MILIEQIQLVIFRTKYKSFNKAIISDHQRLQKETGRVNMAFSPDRDRESICEWPARPAQVRL